MLKKSIELSNLIKTKIKKGDFIYKIKGPVNLVRTYIYWNLLAIDRWVLNTMLGPLWNILFDPRIKFGYPGLTMSTIMGMNLAIGCNGRFGFFKIVCKLLAMIDEKHCHDAAKYELTHGLDGEIIEFTDKTPRSLPVKKTKL